MRLAAAFADNPIHRPVESGAPGGNRTHISQIALSVLSQLNYGTSHKASQSCALLCGCGSAPSAAQVHGSANSDGQVARSNGGTPCRESNPDRQGFRHGRYALLMVEDNRSTSAHRNWNGQEAGICTRTVSFTGRDAANYTTILNKMEPLVGLAPTITSLQNSSCGC